MPGLAPLWAQKTSTTSTLLPAGPPLSGSEAEPPAPECMSTVDDCAPVLAETDLQTRSNGPLTVVACCHTTKNLLVSVQQETVGFCPTAGSVGSSRICEPTRVPSAWMRCA